MSRVHGLFASCGVLVLVSMAGPTYAQNDERIEDPELGGAPAQPAADSGGGGDVIEDPELAGKAASTTVASDSSPPTAPLSEVHLVLHARGNRDLRTDDPREEIWESSTILALDATLRRSESLRFGLGVVARYHFASLAHSLPDVEATRYELDALPSAAYIDGSISSVGLHIRAGYQPVALGRFDLFSGINLLSVADLRDGPLTSPDVPEVGQLGLKVDFSPGSWLSLQAIYVPFFMPHLMPITDSDYALIPGNQRSTDAVFAALQDLLPIDELQGYLRRSLSRSSRDRIAGSALAAFAPQPSLAAPQGAVRATARAPSGEYSLTLLTALEHLPTFRLSDFAIAALTDPQTNPNQFDPDFIRAEYKRFAVISLDAGIDLAPFTIGFEAAYQFRRTLYSVGTAYEGDPLAIPVPGFTDLIQLAARAEYAESATWLMVVEAFASYAVWLPNDPQRGWMYFETGRFYRGIAGVAGYNSDFGLHLQLSAAWLSGPTIVIAPRIAYDILTELQIELGAFLVEGQAPPNYSTPILALGGTFNAIDHVFVGLRCAL